ncbi:MAG: response regulator transcription factor [Flavobacteriaceae bacterium]|jgi:DNA-binding response OmpR family regulator|nr:response regulator transcription factor [Flavobacteriaceae bacterium]
MNKKIKLLLVEDDPSFGAVLKDYLSLNDYNVTLAVNGEDGVEKFKSDTFDICISDVMMPKKDGFTFAKEIIDINPDVPIIFLTAKNMREDILTGYKLGANDYITKPFDSEVLLYKINAILQRNSNNTNNNHEDKDVYEFSNFKFSPKLRDLEVNDVTYKLSPKENELLKLLCKYKNDLMPREEALLKIWHKDNYFTSRSMDVYIAKIRKLLKDDENVEIVNIHGEGFRLLVKN